MASKIDITARMAITAMTDDHQQFDQGEPPFSACLVWQASFFS